MRPLPIRRAAADSTPVALRSKASLRTVLATAVAAAVGFVPAIMIASPAAAAVAGTYTIADAGTVEGNTITFAITRAASGGPTLPAETVGFRTSGGTATAGSDYTAVTAGTVAFTSGTALQTQYVTVTTLQDTVDEVAETFTVTLTDPSVANTPDLAGPVTATGTITDDDVPTFTLSASQITVNEGASAGVRQTVITATLSQTPAENVTIPVSTQNGTAIAGQDYTATSGPFTFNAGVDTTDTITVPILDDVIDEADVQNFTVATTAGVNVGGTQSLTIGIVDNDAAPVLTLGNATIAEGGVLQFTPTLTGQSENTVTARWDTADGPAGTPTPGNGTARAGQDYTAVTSGTLTFNPLTSTPTNAIRVNTLVDDLDEAAEDLSVVLSAASNATLGTPSSGTGTITDSGATTPPGVTLTPGQVTEGAPGATRARTFTVRLSKASGQTQKVSYTVAAGSAGAPGSGIQAATAGVDFTAVSSPVELTFEPGEVEKTFTVDIIGDNVDENNGDNIVVTLADVAGGGTLNSGGALTANTVVITDDDDRPSVSLVRENVTVNETDGYAAALVTVQLSNPTINNVSFDVANVSGAGAGTATEGGSGIGEDDYDLVTSSPVVIQGGQSTGYAFVLIKGDDVYEPDETAKFTVTRTAGAPGDSATGAASTATVTIQNDDEAPVLVINDATVTEGGAVALTATVNNVAQNATPFSITFAGQSVSGSDPAEETDFVAPGPVLVSVPGGTPSGTAFPVRSLQTTQDTVDEARETIVVSGIGFNNVGSVTRGVVSIEDDDVTPEEPVAVTPTLNVAEYRLGVGELNLTGTAAANAAVELWAGPLSGGDLVRVATTTASAQGQYNFTREFTTMGYRFQVRSTGKYSTIRTVWLRHDPVLVANSPSRGVATLKVYGDPKLAGLSVILQWLNPATGQWERAGAGTTSASGLLIKNITGLRTGTQYAFRAYVVGNEGMGLQGGYSGTRRVTVK